MEATFPLMRPHQQLFMKVKSNFKNSFTQMIRRKRGSQRKMGDPRAAAVLHLLMMRVKRSIRIKNLKKKIRLPASFAMLKKKLIK